MFLEKLPTSIVDKIITFLPSHLTFLQKIEYMEVLGMDTEYSPSKPLEYYKKWETLPIETRQIHLKNKTLRELILVENSADFVIHYDAKFGAHINLFNGLNCYDFDRDLYHVAESRDITVYREDLDPADFMELHSTIKGIYTLYFGGKQFLVYYTRE